MEREAWVVELREQMMIVWHVMLVVKLHKERILMCVCVFYF